MVSNQTGSQSSSDQFSSMQSPSTAPANPMSQSSHFGQQPTDVHLPSASAPLQTSVQQNSTSQQPQVQSSKGTNRINRIIIGGLVGGTLGSIAAALANRKTAEGFSRASEGTKTAFKSIGAGLGQAAKGVGDAAKSIGDGIGYAIVGNAQETTEGIREGAQQIGDAVQSTAQSAAQSAANAVNTVGQNVSDQVGTAAQSSGQPAQSAMGSGSQFSGSAEQSDLLSDDQGETDLITAVILEAMETDTPEGESLLPDMIILQEETPQILLQDNPFSEAESFSSSEYSDAESSGSSEYRGE